MMLTWIWILDLDQAPVSLNLLLPKKWLKFMFGAKHTQNQQLNLWQPVK